MTAGRERRAHRVDEPATPPDTDDGTDNGTDNGTGNTGAAGTGDTAEHDRPAEHGHECAAEPVPPDPAAAVDALEERVLGRRYDQVRDREDETRADHDISPDGAGTGANPEPSD